MVLGRLQDLSIKWKLVLIVIFVATIVSVADIVLFSVYDAKSDIAYKQRRTQTAARLMGLSAISALSFNDPDEAMELLRSFNADDSVRAAYLFTADGSLLGHYLADDEMLSVPLISADYPEEQFLDDRYILLHRIHYEDKMVGTLYLLTNLEELHQRRRTTLTIAGITALGAFFVSILLALMVQGLFTNPIRELQRILQDISVKKDYSVRARKHGSDELGELVDGFNLMLAEIQQRDQKLAEQMNLLEQNNRELDLRVAERTEELNVSNKELESFSYSVSHDLRAPLRSIDGFSRLLLEDFGAKLDPEAKRLLGIISHDVQKMGELIDDLLAFSRLGRQAMGKTKVDMHDLVQQIYAQLKEAAPNRNVKFDLQHLPPAMGDHTMLRQAFINLISNALKFTSTRELAVIEVEAKINGDRTIYSVKDNGVGFDSRFKDKLFGVFQRLHSEEEFEGTGVGLALVQRIVGRHDGEVYAESEVDKGATFYISLPTEGASA